MLTWIYIYVYTFIGNATVTENPLAIVAVTGRKGGIGKSTITANLAGELVALGRRVAVLDTDPQQSLVKWAGIGEGILADVIEAIETDHPQQFRKVVDRAAKVADCILIDTPPGFADPALLAALLADVVLLPAGPSPLDVMAAGEALESAREAPSAARRKKTLNPLHSLQNSECYHSESRPGRKPGKAR